MTLQPNQLFNDRYLLLQKLGSGGFSEVWLAEDTKSNRLQVALKVFAVGTGLDSEGLSNFSGEYALVFNLNHNHLLRPMHYDDWNGMPFLVMQYIPAGSCSRMCGKTPEETLANFLVQIGSALHYLHSQDPPIIHQDIKPDNVLVDAKGNFLLTDFGISTKIRKTLTKSMGNAQSSAGTTAYMAPERFSRKLDERAPVKANDIFSLGVTAFEMLTDELPYGDLGGVAAHAGSEPADLPDSFSPELGQLLAACLAKNPWERPTAEFLMQSAQAFLKNGKWLLPEAARNTPPEETQHPQPDKKYPHAPVEPPANTAPVKEGRVTQKAPAPLQEKETTGNDQPKTAPKLKIPLGIGFAVIVVIAVVLAIWIPRGPSVNEIEETKSAIGKDMVFVKGGTFTMGCTAEQGNDCLDREKPAHQVTLSDFYIGKYEVTQKQWREVMGASASLSNPSYFNGCDDCPVEQVSWNDIQEFIKKLNQKTGKKYRLPTEAEWEYAARGGSTSSASTSSAFATKYAGSNNIDEVAWYISNSGGKTHPVGGKKPNELGIYDMSGNVWEWCEDDWHDNYNGAPANGHAWVDSPRGSARVLRGGSCYFYYGYCRVSDRHRDTPDSRYDNYGFRLAQDF